MLMRERRTVESRVNACASRSIKPSDSALLVGSGNNLAGDECRGRLRRMETFRYELRSDEMSSSRSVSSEFSVQCRQTAQKVVREQVKFFQLSMQGGTR
jgi:hypothetical protein